MKNLSGRTLELAKEISKLVAYKQNITFQILDDYFHTRLKGSQIENDEDGMLHDWEPTVIEVNLDFEEVAAFLQMRGDLTDYDIEVFSTFCWPLAKAIVEYCNFVRSSSPSGKSRTLMSFYSFIGFLNLLKIRFDTNLWWTENDILDEIDKICI